jgi:hypothetical protein
LAFSLLFQLFIYWISSSAIQFTTPRSTIIYQVSRIKMDNTDINTLDNAVDTSAYSKSKINDAELRTTSEPPLPTGGKFWIAFATVSFGMFFSGYVSSLRHSFPYVSNSQFSQTSKHPGWNMRHDHHPHHHR